MKQTAVEWLRDLYENRPAYEECILEDEWEKALEMEKEQIIEAHFNGCETGEMFNNENRAFITDSEQYYNRTFKQQEQ